MKKSKEKISGKRCRREVCEGRTWCCELHYHKSLGLRHKSGICWKKERVGEVMHLTALKRRARHDGLGAHHPPLRDLLPGNSNGQASLCAQKLRNEGHDAIASCLHRPSQRLQNLVALRMARQLERARWMMKAFLVLIEIALTVLEEEGEKEVAAARRHCGKREL
jgi:hypothetical protein